MKILLLAGTGAIGNYLRDILIEQGYDVHISSRRANRDTDKVTYIQGTIREEKLKKHIADSQYDVIYDFMVYNTYEFNEIHELLLKNTKHYIFFSSARVYADTNDYISEESPRILDCCDDKEYLDTDEYALTKARQENILLNSELKNFTIIRPYITYANDRLQLGILEKENWLYRALKGRSIIFTEDISNHITTLTYGYDVAKVLAELICNRKYLTKIVQIASNTSITWNEVLNIYTEAIKSYAGIEPKVVMLKNAQQVSKILSNGYQLKYDRTYDRRFKSNYREDLITEYVSPQYGLNLCIKEFIQNGADFKGINWDYNAWADRVAGERTPLSEIPRFKTKVKYILIRYFKLFYRT